MDQEVLDRWIKQGKDHNSLYLIVLFDLETKEYWPLFTNEDPIILSKRFISEAKQRIIDYYSLQ